MVGLTPSTGIFNAQRLKSRFSTWAQREYKPGRLTETENRRVGPQDT